MANDCYVKQFKKVVNNDAIPKYGEVVFELVHQPSGYPQMSGSVTVQNTAISTTVRIVDKDQTVTFTNGSGRSFVIDNSAAAANRGLGTTKDTKVGVYPGSNFILNQINEHFKEVPSSICYASSITALEFTITSDKTDSSYVFDFDGIKNVFKAPMLRSITFSRNAIYQGTVEQLLIAAQASYSGRQGLFDVGTAGYALVGLTFHNSGVAANSTFVIRPSDSLLKVYSSGAHMDEPAYLLATYDGSTWTYTS